MIRVGCATLPLKQAILSNDSPHGKAEETIVHGGNLLRNTNLQTKRMACAKLQQSLKNIALILGMMLLSWYPPNLVRAAMGDLDPSFGSGGKISTDFFGGGDGVLAIATQPDGKILAAGFAFNSATGFDFALTRYNSNGSLDASFGSGGKVTTDFFGFRGNESAEGIALQPDGKIVLAGDLGLGGFSFALARYNSDGSLDTNFGGGGKVITPFGGTTEGAHAITIQRDGKIVAVGATVTASGNLGFALVRYNSDGSLDNSFGSSGKVTTDFSGVGEAGANAVAIQSDGKIVAAGSALQDFDLTTFDFALARYNRDGSLDVSFGSGGKVTTDFFGARDEARAIALQSGGKLVLAGSARNSTSFDFALARYNGNGSLDASFGSGGKTTTDFSGSGGSDGANAIAIQSNGRILAAGFAFNGTTDFDFALTRYDSNGSLDASFGSGGKVTTDFFGNLDQANAIAIQSDGKIVLAGFALNSETTFDFALARYDGDSGANFDLCLQDDSTGNLLRFSSTTGDYQFVDCKKGVTLVGRGTVAINFCKISLQDSGPDPKRPDRSVSALFNSCSHIGNATIRLLPARTMFNISDSNTTNNACACP
jgi:uncharacterized delta-60 repeat protein